MENSENETEICNVLALSGARHGIYVLLTIYDESNALNPAGQVCLTDRTRAGSIDMLLSTNDSLSCMWSSPAGHAWIGSAAGNVFTTAPAPFEPATDTGVAMDCPDDRYRWSVTKLPNLRARGFAPNVTAIWGLDDENVFAATFEGSIYNWNGSRWTEMETGVTSGLIEIRGTGSDDIYCVGDNAVILHYDGATWTRLPAPKELDTWAMLTGVRAGTATDVRICEVGGKILRGNTSGFKVVASTSQSWHAVACFKERWILASNPGGAWEMTDTGLVCIKDNFDAVGVFEVGDLLFFIETDQIPRPCSIEYDPADSNSPWGRRTY